MGQQRHSFLSLMSIENDIVETLTVTCREGSERGDDPGLPSQGSIQKVKLQKLKCYNQMIFRIVKLLTHPAWIQFFETCLYLPTLVFTQSNAGNVRIFNALVLYSRCAWHIQ